jgi:chromosome segregation ATPase
MSADQLDALEAAIKERRKVLRQAATRLPRLEERRAALAAQLREVESAIAVFTGEAPPERKAARKPTGKPARSRKAAR